MKSEIFTRRENKFCSIVYYIDMDKNKIQVCATFIVGNVVINIFTCEDMIYIFILHLFKIDKNRIEQLCLISMLHSIVTNCSTIFFNMLTTMNNVDSTTLFKPIFTNTGISLLKLSEFTCADKQNLKQNKYNFIKSCLDYNFATLILRYTGGNI